MNIEKITKILKKIWKPCTVVFVALVIVLVAHKFASAGTVSVTINGNQLSDGKWETGSDPVTWTASAFDADANAQLSLEDGGTIKWESSDPNIVSVTQSAQGTESSAVLRPVSAGKVTISATYNKTVTDEEGTYDVTAKSERTVVVKFKIDSTKVPTAPYEDDWIVPAILTNSDKPVKWTSSNDSVVSVADDGNGNGNITINGAGSATITATTDDGQKESFPVAVNARFREASSSLNVKYGEYYTLTTNAKKPSSINYMSANPTIASVDKDGTVKALSAGKTNLYVYALDQSHPWYSLQPNPMRYLPIKVDFEIVADSKLVAVGDTLKIKTNVSDENKNAVNWTSSDTNVATVDSNGVVTAIKKGSAVINANIVNQTLFGTSDMQSASVNINVIDSFMLSESEHILNSGESFVLKGIVTDNAASVTWTSSDDSIVKVSTDRNDPFQATVTAVRKGKAIITGTQIINGVSKKATCEVSVKEPVQNITISPSEIQIVRGTQYRLIANFTPARPDNMNISWVSSNPEVVSVDDLGIITGVKGGQAAVSVITEDGIKVASCTVSVREPVTSIKMEVNRVETSLKTKTYQLTYTIGPSGDGVNRDVTWMSSAPDVATVSENGLVTFLKPGKATIVVKTVDPGISGNLIDTCEFYINNPVTAVDLDYTSITLKLGEQFRLTAKVTPDDATNKTILWSSSDTNVVTVNENGMVTSVGSGSATILAKSEDSGATSMCNVTVYQPVTSLTISNETMTVRKGTEFWLSATALPENAMNKTVNWSSSDTTIATVDKNGKVTTLEPGNCVITATSQDSGVIAKCTVTVTQPIDGIYLNISQNTIMKGDKFIIVPTVSPVDATNKNVLYTSSDTSVAAVDADGVVTGIKGGRAIIIAKTEERGLVASCLVTVQEFVSSVKIDTQVQRISIGQSVPLKTTVQADSATNKRLSWSTTNGNILGVDQSGKISGAAPGTAVVYASSVDGSGAFDTMQVEVVRPVSSVLVNPSSVSIPEGRTTNLSVNVSPGDATYRDVEWFSENPSIATVDGGGQVTGISAGTCKIYVKAVDGSNVLGACRVSVTPTVAATGVVINSKSITMMPGQTRKLIARLKPTKSTESVEWMSGDTSVATVSSNGTVTARGQGQTEIYAISSETGVESTCEVIVLALNATYITLEQYDTYDLDVFGATDKIKWYSNNKRVATVSSSGKVVARMCGTTTITAKVNGKVLYCTVHVTTMK